MKKTAAVLMAFILILSLAACSTVEKEKDEQVSGEPSSETDENTITVKTPYADLKIPASFDGKVENEVTSKNPYTVTFSSAEDGTELFSVVFNGDGDVLLGTIIGEKENTVVYMNLPELNKKDKNYELYAQLQEKSYVITTYLKEDYEFLLNVAQEREDNATFDIKTDIVTLQYPTRWKDKVTIDVSADNVAFSCGDTKLFDISFVKTDDGFLLGKYKETPIYLITYELKSDKFSEEEFAQLNEMQEDYSVILDNLVDDSDFVLE